MSCEFQNTISHHPEFCWQALAPAAGISLNFWLSTLSHLKHLYGSQVFCGTFLSVSSTRSWALEPLSFCGCILGSEHKVWDAEIHTVYEIKEWINSVLYCVGAVGGLQRRHVSTAPPRVWPTHILSFLPSYHVKTKATKDDDAKLTRTLTSEAKTGAWQGEEHICGWRSIWSVF